MALNVIKVSQVSPATDSIAPLILPLTFFDLLWLNLNPVQRVTFYKHTELSHGSFHSLILPKLEKSLGLALAHFLPLSGRIKWDPQDPKPHIVICPRDTVSLTVAETHADFSRASGKGLRHLTELRPLVPKFPVSSSDSVSIFALQITFFPGQGFCIGIAVNHAAVDGKTVVNFLKTWAHISKYGTMPQDFHVPMLLDRTAINVPAELELKILELPPYNLRTLQLPPAKDIEEVVRITLELSEEDVKKLRERVKTHSARSDLHLSTFVVSYAYALTCLVKARGGEDEDQPVPFTYVADFRDRLDPPVPLNYFGNCVVPISISGYKAKTFLGEEGFVNGVSILSDSVRGLSSRGRDSIWELYEEGLKMMVPGVQKLIVGGGSNKFGIYGSDFGWGRPVHTENITLARNILFTMSERRDETGGVEIGMSLKKCEMDVFVSVFLNGLQN